MSILCVKLKNVRAGIVACANSVSVRRIADPLGVGNLFKLTGEVAGIVVKFCVLGYNASFTTKRAGSYRPFFLVDCFLMQPFKPVASLD
jgi:hypothetical protein